MPLMYGTEAYTLFSLRDSSESPMDSVVNVTCLTQYLLMLLIFTTENGRKLTHKETETKTKRIESK